VSERKPEIVTTLPDDLTRDDEPPVVARLVVEIRSDGSHTIARGAIEELQRGERVAIEAHGDTPLQLALALARSLASLPLVFARSTQRAAGGRLLGGFRRSVRGLLGRSRR
jgi:hypothetical protein